MKYSNVGIIGAGNWGTTLALILDSQGKKVKLFEPIRERFNNLKKWRENKEFLPGYKIPESVFITNEPKELSENCDFIFFVLPSKFVGEIASLFKSYIDKDKIVASFIKGVDPDSLKRISEIIEAEIPSQKREVVVVSGPSIAREVVMGVPTSLVAASFNLEKAKKIQRFLSSDKLRVYTSSDVIGVELGGAFKNVYAIASGICDGMSLGMNAKAALITRGMAELSLLGEKMGGRKETFAGLSGFGDLIVTSFSPYSRNRTFGERLGRGESVEKILSEMVEVVEGIRTTKSIVALSNKYKVEMPIAKEVYSVLYEGKSPFDSMRDLMKRELKEEWKK
ncbi:MAG: NAD(P)H-dependent glycerol-3-phosphate dehydrogenase [candidate division WOR-3 bacterium]